MNQGDQSRGQGRKPWGKSQDGAWKNNGEDDGKGCRNRSGVQNGPQANYKPKYRMR